MSASAIAGRGSAMSLLITPSPTRWLKNSVGDVAQNRRAVEGRVREVGWDRDRAAPELAHLLERPVKRALELPRAVLAADKRNIRPFEGEPQRERAADSTTSPCDDGDPSSATS